jgi:hypothetical protein
MKNFLFTATSFLLGVTIMGLEKAGPILANLILFVCQALKVALANLAMFLLRRLDPAKMEEIEAGIELTKQQTELQLLDSASKLRDHALEEGEWTESHSEAIYAIANALGSECGWDEEHVDTYIREIVESIPGLTYGDDEDDDEDDLLY